MRCHLWGSVVSTQSSDPDNKALLLLKDTQTFSPKLYDTTNNDKKRLQMTTAAFSMLHNVIVPRLVSVRSRHTMASTIHVQHKEVLSWSPPPQFVYLKPSAVRAEWVKTGGIMVALRSHLHAVRLLKQTPRLYGYSCSHMLRFMAAPDAKFPACSVRPVSLTAAQNLAKWHTQSAELIFYFLQGRKQRGCWGHGELCDPFLTTSTNTSLCMCGVMYVCIACVQTAGVCVYI